MKIGIGRRQLVVAIVTDSCGAAESERQYPMALNATDHDLARLNALRDCRVDRMRWESTAVLHGSVRLRTM